ncbi:hypothetical protein GCM10009599_11350 [Luteococcus peritonei]
MAAQAKDFVQRGMPSKDAGSNFTRIRRRWDPAAYGDALGLTEREAKLMLVAVGYREVEHGLCGLTPFRRSSRYESRPVARGRGQGDWSDHDEQQEASHPGAGRP